MENDLTCGGAGSCPGTTLFKPRSQEETASVRHDAMQVNAWQSMSMSWKTSFSPKHLHVGSSFADLEYG